MLEPTADGFRNYFGNGNRRSPAEMLVDRANQLTLTVPEMTVLIGVHAGSECKCRDKLNMVCSPTRPGTLSNDFFVNLLDMSHAMVEVFHIRGRLRGS